MMRRVISLWLPALATDRICRGRPDWRAEPLVTAATENGARVIRAANATARANGLRPGFKVADGRAMVPHLRILDDDPARDRRTLDTVADWCDRYTPFAACDGRDGLFLDVTGGAHLFGGEAAMLTDILGRLDGFGFAGRGAVADTPGAAWAVARHGHTTAQGAVIDCVVPPNGGPAALAGLPVAGLRLDAALADTLDRLGLKLIGDLAALPRPALAARFGAGLCRRLDQALGTVGEPISPRRPAPALRIRLAFAEPVARQADIAYALDRLLADLCRQLEKEHRGARRLDLALFQSGGGVIRLSAGTSAPTRDPRHLARLFAEPLAQHAPDPSQVGTEIESAVLAAAETGPFVADQLALDEGTSTGTEVAALVDRLANRLGAGNVFRMAPIESHIPERAVAARNAVAVRRGDAAGWRHYPPRPLRLLARPVPVEVVASIPEGPPALVRWQHQTLRIRHAAGPERIAAEWWRERAPTRDYYRVEDLDGRRLWLYRAGLHRPDTPPRWFLHGLFA